jgi:hypothetical protein
MAARLTGRRWAPVLVLAVSVAIGMVGVQIARVGFEIVQPVSVIGEEIAKDPTSPIAVANEIARKNRDAPGAGGLAVQVRSLVPVLILILVDPRRRPVAAAAAYGVALLSTTGWTLAHSPAFAPMTPGMEATLIGLALTVLAGVAGGLAGKLVSARWAALLVLIVPGPAEAYVDPTGGGFLLQLLLGGGTALVLLMRAVLRRLASRLGRHSRHPK